MYIFVYACIYTYTCIRYAFVGLDNKKPHVVCFLLGDSPTSEIYMPKFRNALSVPSS